MSKKVELNLEEEIEVCCSVTRAVKGDGPGAYYGPTPDEPAEIEDLYVGVIIKGKTIDITNLLDEKQIAYFEEKVWLHLED
jgi:hypothetical protein